MEEKKGFRTFVILWVTQSISAFGSSLTFFTLSLWITTVLYPAPDQRAQLASALSAISLANALPTLAVAPLAGVLADRYDRKRLMIWSNLAHTLLSMVLATLLFTDSLKLSSLVVITIISSILGAVHGSAFDTSYAMVVSDRLLPRANGMMQTMWALAGVLSPAVAALVLAVPALARQSSIRWLHSTFLTRLQSGAPLVISIDAITFLIAALVLPCLHIPSPKRKNLSLSPGMAKPSIVTEATDGFRYILARRPLLWLLLTFAMFNFLTGPLNLLMPLLVRFNLASDWSSRGLTFEASMAMLSTMASIGGVAGGFLISLWGGLKERRVYGVIFPMVVFGLLFLVFGLSPFIYLSAGLLLLICVLGPIMNAHSQSIWQRQTPKEMQGRVFAVRRLIAQVSYPVATAVAGWTAGRVDPGIMAATLGGLAAVLAGAQLLNKGLLRVDDRDYIESLTNSSEQLASISG
ncbi:MAG: MFS transporter [Bacillota bacterium]